MEPIWNRSHVAYVHIDVPESLSNRGLLFTVTSAPPPQTCRSVARAKENNIGHQPAAVAAGACSFARLAVGPRLWHDAQAHHLIGRVSQTDMVRAIAEHRRERIDIDDSARTRRDTP